MTIRKLRLEKGYTQKELADKLGISESAVSLIENGKRKLKLETAIKLAEIFGVSLDELVKNYVNDTTPVG